MWAAVQGEKYLRGRRGEIKSQRLSQRAPRRGWVVIEVAAEEERGSQPFTRKRKLSQTGGKIRTNSGQELLGQEHRAYRLHGKKV